MIKVVLRNLLVASTMFYLVLLFTAPKEELWYQIEHTLYDFGVVIDNEKLKSGFIELEANDGSIHFEALKVGDFQSNSLLITLFYNHFLIKELKFGEDMANFKNFQIDDFYITHSIFSPMTLSLQGEGNFGSLKGRFDIENRKLDLLIQPSKRLLKVRTVMKHLKKHEEGYIYNAKF